MLGVREGHAVSARVCVPASQLIAVAASGGVSRWRCALCRTSGGLPGTEAKALGQGVEHLIAHHSGTVHLVGGCAL